MAGLAQTSIGTLVNLVANDTMFYEKSVMMIGQVVACPVVLFISILLLIMITGWSGAIGLILYFILFFFVIELGRYMGTLRTKTGHQADQRITILEELLNAIQVVKMYCLEEFFLQKLTDRRTAEIDIYRLQAFLNGLSYSFMFFSAQMLVIAIYTAGFYLDHEGTMFNTSTIFTIVIY